MFFSFPVTIPANTPATAPVTSRLAIVGGTVERVEVQFPYGCDGLAHLEIWRGLSQVWPSSAGNDFAADNETISWDEDYDATQPPFEFIAYAWNLDDTYNHTVTVRIQLKPSGPVAQALIELGKLIGLKGGA